MELDFIFKVCLGLGFILPLLSIVGGAFGAIFDFNLDVDTDFEGVIPFNVMSLCMGLISFGAIGLLTIKDFSAIFSLMASLLIGVVIYFAFYYLVIKKLRRNNPKALEGKDIVGREGVVTLNISSNIEGTISINDSTGAKITYRAKSISNDITSIEVGEKIRVINYDKNTGICYVIREREEQIWEV